MSIKCINVLIEGTECKPQIKSWYFHSKKANFTQIKNHFEGKNTTNKSIFMRSYLIKNIQSN